ncbi:hypothetical protein [Caulobacter hibisci]|uniref:Uncharacterized protein n=1 Tax=Caulobacter hibisci TaxID=2035993 RepID=A0ABS0STK3_9CAUL|nr:hypothetical protein [Caulobacter hibisci]MBI1682928.1 hypothetical protein [Caulobacter hibisci]
MRTWMGLALAAGMVAAAGLGVAFSQTRVDPATGPATRAPVAVAAAVARPRSAVDWQGAVGGLRRSGGAGDNLAANLDRAAVDRTRLPILLPVDAKLTAGARIYSFGDYYTITADAKGAGVSLSGTTAVIPTAKPLKVEVGPESLTVQRTVDGQLASFVRYGVLYTVEVRCDAPGDLRCADDNYVLGLVGKTTAVVLGAAARAEAGLGG